MSLQYLDPEIANEGELAMLPGEGTPAPMDAPHIPDYSWVIAKDKIAKYFRKFVPYHHKAYPTWVYHPTEEPRLLEDRYTREDPPRLIKSAKDQAADLGVIFRKTTPEELAQGFPATRWEFKGDWRTTPYKVANRSNAYGKTMPPPSQTEVIATAVATAMRAAGSANGSADIIGATVAAVMAALGKVQTPSTADPAHAMENLTVKTVSEEKAALTKVAEESGIKVDKRWSTDRLKAELDKIVAPE